MSTPTKDFFQNWNNQSEQEKGETRRNVWGQRIDDYIRSMVGRQSYYQEKSIAENEQYWADYLKNTGVEAKYPIRSGTNPNVATSFMPNTAMATKPIQMLYGKQSTEGKQ